MSHTLDNLESIAAYVLAGRSVFTLVSRSTGQHRTYRVKLKKYADPQRGPYFVSSRDEADAHLDEKAKWHFLGTFWLLDRQGREQPTFAVSPKSDVPKESQTMRGIVWFLAHLFTDTHKLGQVQFMHEGRCGRCGRELTDPESIQSGLGPECRRKVA